MEPANDMSMAAQEADVSVDTQKHDLPKEVLKAAHGKNRQEEKKIANERGVLNDDGPAENAFFEPKLRVGFENMTI